jgi:hypothetical protein
MWWGKGLEKIWMRHRVYIKSKPKKKQREKSLRKKHDLGDDNRDFFVIYIF